MPTYESTIEDIDELQEYWFEQKYWNNYRREIMMPKLRSDLREFKDENESFKLTARKRYLLEQRQYWLDKISEYCDHVEALNLPVWEEEWLLVVVKVWRHELKKINSELTYVYGNKKKKGQVTEVDIENARNVDVISLNLISDARRAGSKYVAKCLWHDEKTASMSINGNRVYCYGCHHKGSAIDVVMQVQNLSFIQAVKYLI